MLPGSQRCQTQSIEKAVLINLVVFVQCLRTQRVCAYVGVLCTTDARSSKIAVPGACLRPTSTTDGFWFCHLQNGRYLLPTGLIKGM